MSFLLLAMTLLLKTTPIGQPHLASQETMQHLGGQYIALLYSLVYGVIYQGMLQLVKKTFYKFSTGVEYFIMMINTVDQKK